MDEVCVFFIFYFKGFSNEVVCPKNTRYGWKNLTGGTLFNKE